MKKLLLLFLCALLPGMASAFQGEVTVDGIHYIVDTDTKVAGVMATSLFSSYEDDIEIPAYIQYDDAVCMVISISSGAFSGSTNLTSVTIPQTVINIGERAFYGCRNLKTIDLPPYLTAIGDYAFFNCENLLSISLPNSVSQLGKFAFFGCKSLNSVNISNKLTEIGECTFYGCSSLQTVVIPQGVQRIGDGAFTSCTRLQMVDIPSSVTTIEGSAFSGCTNLTTAPLPASVREIGTEAFRDCSRLASVTIPAGVTRIKNSTFYGCTNLTAVNIPSTVTSIGGAAFYGCTKLATISLPEGVKKVDNQAFYGCNRLKTVYLPSTLTDLSWNVFYGCNTLADVYCYTASVPTTEGEAFDGSNVSHATLHAHDYVIQDFRTTNPWSKFAKFLPLETKTYKLSYYVNGELYKSYDILFDAEITPESAPESSTEGYVFSGWSTIPATMPAHDVDIQGSYVIGHYTLQYKIGEEVYKSVELEFGASIEPEADPEREGYTFSGWSEIPETMPGRDVTITGTMTPITYNLVYKVDGKEYKTVALDYATRITPEAAPEREGYTFSGWIDLPETMPAKDTIVVGTFTINEYTLTYMLDNKTYKTVTYQYGAAIQAEPKPVGVDYVSFAWTGLPATMPARNVTVEASYVTSIQSAAATQQLPRHARIYSPRGTLRPQLQKGLNIVVMGDGTKKKIMVE